MTTNFFPLTKENVESLIGKKVEFRAPSYIGNQQYSGVAEIKSVDFSKQNPIDCVCISGDDMKWSFLDYDSVFSYSDNYRNVQVRICE